MAMYTRATLVYLLVTGSYSTFPLIDCEIKETVIFFRVDCEYSVHEQSTFIQKLEHFLRKEKLWKIVNVLYFIVVGTNIEKNIFVNSSSSLSETALKECQRDASYNVNNYGKLIEKYLKYRILLLFFDSRKERVDANFLKVTTDFNMNSKHKMFLITNKEMSGNFIYRTDSYNNLDVLEVYREMCDSKHKCKGTSLNFTLPGYQKSFYNIEHAASIKYKAAVEYCSHKYNSYLLSLESNDELEYVVSLFRERRDSPVNTHKILLGYRENKWESGNAFFWFEPSLEKCLYLRLNTGLDKHTENINSSEIFFYFYSCSDNLTDVYIVCECHEHLDFNGYNRINYMKHSEKYSSVFSVDLTLYKEFSSHVTVYTRNCSIYSNSVDKVLHKFLCEKTNPELLNYEKNEIDMMCLNQHICHDLYKEPLKINVQLPYAVCSFQNDSFPDQYPSIKRQYYYKERNNSSMTFKIEKYETNVSCPKNFYQCLEHVCIELSKLNDGHKDCPLGDDERYLIEAMICKGVVKAKEKEISYLSQCPHSNVTKKGLITSKTKVTMGFNETVSIEVLEFKVAFFKAEDSIVPYQSIILCFPIIDILQIQSTECEITNFETSFKYWDTSKLVSVNLSKNLLTNTDFLVPLSELRHIDLSYNELLTITDDFQFPASLEYIDLSYTHIHSIPTGAFNSTQGLIYLNVGHTKIHKFENIQIPTNFRIYTLNISGLKMVDIQAQYFKDLTIGSQILSDDYRLCCPIVLGVNIDQEKCIAPSDVISSCQHLVGDTFKRITIWIVGLMTLSGNGAVVIYRIKWSQWTFTKAYDIFVTGLAVSDFVMGIYLIIIASVDVHYRDLYVLKHVEWKQGNLCTFSGFLSTVSSEMSTFFICLITIDRYMAITYPFGEHKFSKIGIKLTLLFVCLSGCILALVPAVYPGWEIYSSNGLCLPLPLSTQRFNGWQYSVSVFVFLNFILFLIIAFGQIAIFVSITKSKSSLICKQHNPIARSQEIAIAKKLAFVAVSDFLCWFPIGIMGMFTLNGFEFNPEVYAWMAVFVLPVNSALNPFIYTIPVIYSRFKF